MKVISMSPLFGCETVMFNVQFKVSDPDMHVRNKVQH